jgi:hypothetical protein
VFQWLQIRITSIRMRIRIRIKVKSRTRVRIKEKRWIRIRIKEKSRIRICIKKKRWFRIRTKEKSWIRIRIAVKRIRNPAYGEGWVGPGYRTFFSSAGGSRALVFFFLRLPELTSCACISSAELLYSCSGCCRPPPLLPAASSAPLAITGSTRDAAASGDALRGGNSTSVLLSPKTAVSAAVVLPRPFFRFLRRCSGSGRGGSSGASSAGFSS